MIEELNKICEVKEKAKINNTFKINSICFAMVRPNTVFELEEVVKVLKEKRTGKEIEFIMPENCPVCGNKIIKICS